jgi:hypothetical protein
MKSPLPDLDDPSSGTPEHQRNMRKGRVPVIV